MILLLAAILSLVFHVLLGWQWALVGGVVAGLGSTRLGWVVGTIAVALSWTVLVIYNFAVAPAEMARFIEITSGLFGNMPGAMLVVTTISLGAVLGLLGGVIGSITRSLALSFRSGSADRTPDSTASIDHTIEEINN